MHQLFLLHIAEDWVELYCNVEGRAKMGGFVCGKCPVVPFRSLYKEDEVEREVFRRVAESIPGVTTNRERVEERFLKVKYPNDPGHKMGYEDYAELAEITNRDWKLKYAIDPSAPKTVMGKREGFIHQRDFAQTKRDHIIPFVDDIAQRSQEKIVGEFSPLR